MFAEKLDRNDARKSLGIENSHLIVGTLSSLSTEKGLDYLIKAIAEVKQSGIDIHLLMVGSGPEEYSLRMLASQLSLNDSVTFAGRRSDILNVFSAMDIFALPSLNEGLPMALLEAMATGKAVIAHMESGFIYSLLDV